MKKKYRDITVDGVKYAWSCNSYYVTIWKDKKIILHHNADILLKKGEADVTPKYVAELIKNL